MKSVIQDVADWHNLAWAFRKAKEYHRALYDLCDEFEVAEFELSLSSQLDRIRAELTSGTYRTSPLRLMPIPKKPRQGNPRMRQFFQVAFRDQVAWIALVNIIGPALDQMMPPWVYGYRLYRSTWWRSRSLSASYPHWNGQLYRHYDEVGHYIGVTSSLPHGALGRMLPKINPRLDLNPPPARHQIVFLSI